MNNNLIRILMVNSILYSYLNAMLGEDKQINASAATSTSQTTTSSSSASAAAAAAISTGFSSNTGAASSSADIELPIDNGVSSHIFPSQFELEREFREQEVRRQIKHLHIQNCLFVIGCLVTLFVMRN